MYSTLTLSPYMKGCPVVIANTSSNHYSTVTPSDSLDNTNIHVTFSYGDVINVSGTNANVVTANVYDVKMTTPILLCEDWIIVWSSSMQSCRV